MGCNAHNHPPDCDCGWGGEFHSSTLTSASPPTPQQYIPYFNKRVQLGFTLPNANCPVCGKWVFFYQSPNGGRVFFDSLGHPWPKHPCTDKSSISRRQFSQFLGIISPPWTGAHVNEYHPIGDAKELRDAKFADGNSYNEKNPNRPYSTPHSTLYWNEGSKGKTEKQIQLNFDARLRFEFARLQKVGTRSRLSLLFYENSTKYWVYAWGMLDEIRELRPLNVVHFEGHLPENLHMNERYSTTLYTKRSDAYKSMIKQFFIDKEQKEK